MTRARQIADAVAALDWIDSTLVRAKFSDAPAWVRDVALAAIKAEAKRRLAELLPEDAP